MYMCFYPSTFGYILPTFSLWFRLKRGLFFCVCVCCKQRMKWKHTHTCWNKHEKKKRTIELLDWASTMPESMYILYSSASAATPSQKQQQTKYTFLSIVRWIFWFHLLNRSDAIDRIVWALEAIMKLRETVVFALVGTRDFNWHYSLT